MLRRVLTRDLYCSVWAVGWSVVHALLLAVTDSPTALSDHRSEAPLRILVLGAGYSTSTSLCVALQCSSQPCSCAYILRHSSLKRWLGKWIGRKSVEARSPKNLANILSQWHFHRYWKYGVGSHRHDLGRTPFPLEVRSCPGSSDQWCLWSTRLRRLRGKGHFLEDPCDDCAVAMGV